jgi:acetate kinase
MNILTLNCGSSSLKFKLFEINKNLLSRAPAVLISGKVTIGQTGTIKFQDNSGKVFTENVPLVNHAEGLRHLWSHLVSRISFDAVGHRIVHGGEDFIDPMRIDEKLLKALEEIRELAPLHNGPAVEVIRASRSLFGSGPMVATFDTAFHKTLPEHARHYAIPEELAVKYRLRRYGFHGLAHRWMTERYAALTDSNLHKVKLITLQLGSGCSATAIHYGRSVETSMGLTPLEGLMMATRSGDLDPSIPGLLARREAMDLDQVENLLNHKSGLLGVGLSNDLHQIVEAERRGDRRASLALEMFCHRVRKYVGAYLAVLVGAEAIVFGGGIGENEPVVRARVCAGMEWCGLHLDEKKNDVGSGGEVCISKDNSSMRAYVIPVNEEALIARDTFECLCSTTNRRE